MKEYKILFLFFLSFAFYSSDSDFVKYLKRGYLQKVIL